MNYSNVSQVLWGSKAKLIYLMLGALIILFSFLGGKEIWTQEHRWAEIVWGMFYRNDFFHPYLGDQNYYDKPLLSYWLIALCSYLTGDLGNLELRLPSALAGLCAVFSIFQIGKYIRSESLGFLAGWLLLTTYYFVFWARVSSADMLNLSLSLCAIAWYLYHKTEVKFLNYFCFFILLAIACLCKGLVAAALVFIAVMPDLLRDKLLIRHLNLKLLLALLVGMLLYAAPFLGSFLVHPSGYHDNGLYLVYKENILRFFKPFDHQGSIYTYFIYLPIYLAPWTILIIPAVVKNIKHFKYSHPKQQWLFMVFLLFFLFFTISGSRRSYYILPVIPFAILLIADWMLNYFKSDQWQNILSMVILFLLSMFLLIDFLSSWFYIHYGTDAFAKTLKKNVSTLKPFDIVMLDGESKLNFYLNLPPKTPHFDVRGEQRFEINSDNVIIVWPILNTINLNTIFISRQMYEKILQPYFTHHQLVKLSEPPFPFFKKHIQNSPIAFVPLK